MLAMLAAIDELPSATLVTIAEMANLDKKTVSVLLVQAGEQAGVHIIKTGSAYTIADWGPVFKKTGARMALAGIPYSENVTK